MESTQRKEMFNKWKTDKEWATQCRIKIKKKKK